MAEPSRTLVLVRHAKSSWADENLADHDRPLNPRGMKDAPRMARRLKKRGPVPERILSSSANRALETARAFARILGARSRDVVVETAIYTASVPGMVALVRALDESSHRVMLVGHNPTFSALARYLTASDFDDVPTCAVLTLEQDGRRWAEAGPGSFRLVHFDYPKKSEKKRRKD